MLQGLDIEFVVYILKLSAMRYLKWKCGDDTRDHDKLPDEEVCWCSDMCGEAET